MADEVEPRSIPKRMANWLMRFPLVLLTYLVTQTSTNALKDIQAKVRETSLQIESARLSGMEGFIELVAKKPEEKDECSW